MAFVARFNRRTEGGYICTYGKGSKQLTAVMEQLDGKWKIVAGFAAGGVAADKKCGVVKEGWAALAAGAYGNEVSPETETTIESPAPPVRPGPPSLRKPMAPEGAVESGCVPAGGKATGPPSLRPAAVSYVVDPFPMPDLAPEGVATCPACHMPFHGWTKAPYADYKIARNRAMEHNGERYVPPCRCNEPNDAEYIPDLFDWRMYEPGPTGKRDHLTETGALDTVYHWMLRNKEYCITDGKLDEPWATIQSVLWRNTGYAEYRPEVWNNGEE